MKSYRSNTPQPTDRELLPIGDSFKPSQDSSMDFVKEINQKIEAHIETLSKAPTYTYAYRAALISMILLIAGGFLSGSYALIHKGNQIAADGKPHPQEHISAREFYINCGIVLFFAGFFTTGHTASFLHEVLWNKEIIHNANEWQNVIDLVNSRINNHFTSNEINGKYLLENIERTTKQLQENNTARAATFLLDTLNQSLNSLVEKNKLSFTRTGRGLFTPIKNETSLIVEETSNSEEDSLNSGQVAKKPDEETPLLTRAKTLGKRSNDV